MDSSQNTDSSLALQVKDVHKFYGSGRGAFHVLRSFNMEVQYGAMYVCTSIIRATVRSVVSHLARSEGSDTFLRKSRT